MHKFSDISEIDWKCNWSLEPPFFISATDYLIKQDYEWNQKFFRISILLQGLFFEVVISTLAWRNGKVQLMTKLSVALVGAMLTLSSFFGAFRCRNILLWVSSRFPLWLWIIKGHDCFMSALLWKKIALTTVLEIAKADSEKCNR